MKIRRVVNGYFYLQFFDSSQPWTLATGTLR